MTKHNQKAAPVKRRGAVRGVDWQPVFLNGEQIGAVHQNPPKKLWGDLWGDAMNRLAEHAERLHGQEFNDGRSHTALRDAALTRFCAARGIDWSRLKLTDSIARLDSSGYHFTLPAPSDKKHLDDCCRLLGI